MRKTLIILCFIIGLYAPTSSHSVINNSFPMFFTLLLIPLYFLYIFNGKRIHKFSMVNGMMILITLGVFTILTPFSEYAFGNLVYYFVFALFLCLDLKDVTFNKNNYQLLNSILVANAILCALVILQNEFIIQFFIDNYSMYYPEMNLYALYFKKPVIMFAAHSIAAFYLYLFFYISFLKYKQHNTWFFFILSISYFYFIFSIGSNTAYFFAFIAFVQLLLYFIRNKTRKLIWGMCLSLIPLLVKMNTVKAVFNDYSFKVMSMLTSDHNGLIGRFSTHGNLTKNLHYIQENIFRPVGLGNSSGLFFGDSGVVVHFLRGSIFLVLLVYIGFYLFLRRNIKSQKIAFFLWLIFMAMDIGYNSVINFRTFYMLPFIIVIINSIIDNKKVNRKTDYQKLDVVENESLKGISAVQ